MGGYCCCAWAFSSVRNSIGSKCLTAPRDFPFALRRMRRFVSICATVYRSPSKTDRSRPNRFRRQVYQSGAISPSIIVLELQAGTYYIAIVNTDTSPAGYTVKTEIEGGDPAALPA